MIIECQTHAAVCITSPPPVSRQFCEMGETVEEAMGNINEYKIDCFPQN